MTCGKCGCNCGRWGKGKRSFCVVSFAFAWGITFALFMMVLAWVAMWTGEGRELINSTASLYKGFEPTFVGGLIGAIWGFIEGFIMGALIALFYNLFTCCCKMSCCKKAEGSETCSCNCSCCSKDRPMKDTPTGQF